MKFLKYLLAQDLTDKRIISSVFISYRRNDAAPYAGRISDRLRSMPDIRRVFLDVASVKPGEDFRAAVNKAVASCDVFLAVIGRNWLGTSKGGTQKRIDDPNDMVRFEIASAFRKGITVIPILVAGADMPSPMDLPSDLATLSRLNALVISHGQFEDDIQRLIATMKGESRTKTPAEDKIREILKPYVPYSSDCFYLDPEIPKAKLANARITCKIPKGEKVIALIDLTLFGSSKNYLLFGIHGIYYRNWTQFPWLAKWTLPYIEFPNCRIHKTWSGNEIHIGKGKTIVVTAKIPTKTLTQILNTIKEQMV